MQLTRRRYDIWARAPAELAEAESAALFHPTPGPTPGPQIEIANCRNSRKCEPATCLQIARSLRYVEPRQVFVTEYVPCWLKVGRAIKRADMEMCFGRQARAFAGQCRSAPAAEPAPGSPRRRIEFRYLAPRDRISRSFDRNKNRRGCAAMLTATFTMAPIHAFRLTGSNKTDGAAQAATFELVSKRRAEQHSAFRLFPGAGS